MYPYSVVEGALAEFFGIRPMAQPALRSRIRHIQRAGLAPEKSGNRLLYAKHDIYDLALVLSLSEFGINPKHFVESDVRFLIRDLRKANPKKWDEERWFCEFCPAPLSSQDKAALDFKPEGRLLQSLKTVRGTHPHRASRFALVDLKDLVNRIDAILEP